MLPEVAAIDIANPPKPFFEKEGLVVCSTECCVVFLLDKVIKDFKALGSFDIFRLVTAADRQTVGIYRSSFILRCCIELCAIGGASHPPRSELCSSLPDWDGSRLLWVYVGRIPPAPLGGLPFAP